MMKITERMEIRREFMQKFPENPVLDGRKTYFTREYVQFLEDKVKLLQMCLKAASSV